MFFAVITVATLVIVGGGIAFISLTDRSDTVDRLRRNYNDMIDDNQWRDPITNKLVNIKEMPQLTLERFITLYSANPKSWHIDTYSNQSNQNYYIPYYFKKVGKEVVIIPVFWESWAEMEKFMKWKENELKYGQEAGTQKIRDENMAKLAGYIADDIQVEREKFQKQLDKARNEIQLTLQTKS